MGKLKGTIIQPGDVYNHLTVIKRVEDKKFACGDKKPAFLCECDCDHLRNELRYLSGYAGRGIATQVQTGDACLPIMHQQSCL